MEIDGMPTDTFRLRPRMMLEAGSEEDSLILVDGHSGAMCASNATATVLLRALQPGAAAETLERSLRERFELSPERAARDVVRFLDTLSGLNAIEVVADQVNSNQTSDGLPAGDLDLVPVAP